LNYFRLFNIKPDLLLACVILAAFYFELRQALFLSVFSGLLKDVCGIGPGYLNTVLFVLLCYSIARLSRKISLEHKVFFTVGVFLIVFIYATTVRVVLLFFGEYIPWLIFLRIAFIESFYTALVFPLLCKLLMPVLLIKEIDNREVRDEEL
jgi:rod shape-determining protein MreD